MTDTLDFRSYHDETESHSHDFWQVVLPVKGALDMDIGGRSGAVALGQGALIPAGIRHAFRAEGENRFLVADVQTLALPDRATERFSRSGFFPVAAPVRALIEFRATALWTGETTAAGHWCALLLQALAAAPEPDVAAGRGVEKAIRYMARHLADPIRVADLAAASGLAPHRLNAGFQACYGRSPYAHLGQMRLAEALRLLRETRLPLDEIAYRTGFPDQSALSRSLRKHQGTSPAAYRRAQALEITSVLPE